MVSGRFAAALAAAGIPVTLIEIRDENDRSTWRVEYAPNATAQQRQDGETLRLTFDPNAPSVIDGETTANAAQVSNQKDLLATLAVIAKTVDPTGWAALTTAQKVAKVQSMAADWRTFRLFVEKNL